ncbi:unnamed protein product [Pedinophyceae sp. YPF-701]|nr:unnamed protein product [Pedinophyceae sp. YPF-701]
MEHPDAPDAPQAPDSGCPSPTFGVRPVGDVADDAFEAEDPFTPSEQGLAPTASAPAATQASEAPDAAPAEHALPTSTPLNAPVVEQERAETPDTPTLLPSVDVLLRAATGGSQLEMLAMHGTGITPSPPPPPPPQPPQPPPTAWPEQPAPEHAAVPEGYVMPPKVAYEQEHPRAAFARQMEERGRAGSGPGAYEVMERMPAYLRAAARRGVQVPSRPFSVDARKGGPRDQEIIDMEEVRRTSNAKGKKALERLAKRSPALARSLAQHKIGERAVQRQRWYDETARREETPPPERPPQRAPPAKRRRSESLDAPRIPRDDSIVMAHERVPVLHSRTGLVFHKSASIRASRPLDQRTAPPQTRRSVPPRSGPPQRTAARGGARSSLEVPRSSSQQRRAEPVRGLDGMAVSTEAAPKRQTGRTFGEVVASFPPVGGRAAPRGAPERSRADVAQQAMDRAEEPAASAAERSLGAEDRRCSLDTWASNSGADGGPPRPDARESFELAVLTTPRGASDQPHQYRVSASEVVEVPFPSPPSSPRRAPPAPVAQVIPMEPLPETRPPGPERNRYVALPCEELEACAQFVCEHWQSFLRAFGRRVPRVDEKPAPARAPDPHARPHVRRLGDPPPDEKPRTRMVPGGAAPLRAVVDIFSTLVATCRGPDATRAVHDRLAEFSVRGTLTPRDVIEALGCEFDGPISIPDVQTGESTTVLAGPAVRAHPSWSPLRQREQRRADKQAAAVGTEKHKSVVDKAAEAAAQVPGASAAAPRGGSAVLEKLVQSRRAEEVAKQEAELRRRFEEEEEAARAAEEEAKKAEGRVDESELCSLLRAAAERKDAMLGAAAQRAARATKPAQERAGPPALPAPAARPVQQPLPTPAPPAVQASALAVRAEAVPRTVEASYASHGAAPQPPEGPPVAPATAYRASGAAGLIASVAHSVTEDLDRVLGALTIRRDELAHGGARAHGGESPSRTVGRDMDTLRQQLASRLDESRSDAGAVAAYDASVPRAVRQRYPQDAPHANGGVSLGPAGMEAASDPYAHSYRGPSYPAAHTQYPMPGAPFPTPWTAPRPQTSGHPHDAYGMPGAYQAAERYPKRVPVDPYGPMYSYTPGAFHTPAPTAPAPGPSFYTDTRGEFGAPPSPERAAAMQLGGPHGAGLRGSVAAAYESTRAQADLVFGAAPGHAQDLSY